MWTWKHVLILYREALLAQSSVSVSCFFTDTRTTIQGMLPVAQIANFQSMRHTVVPDKPCTSIAKASHWNGGSRYQSCLTCVETRHMGKNMLCRMPYGWWSQMVSDVCVDIRLERNDDDDCNLDKSALMNDTHVDVSTVHQKKITADSCRRIVPQKRFCKGARF